RWRPEPRRGGTSRRYVGQNPLPGATIYYSLTTKADKVSVKGVDYTGKTVRELTAPTGVGLNRVTWDLTQAAPRGGGAGPGERGGARRGGGGGRGTGAAAATRGGAPGRAAEPAQTPAPKVEPSPTETPRTETETETETTTAEPRRFPGGF